MNSSIKTTIDELQTLISIVDFGSITAAAEHLGQTTSAVSRTLSRLEMKLDVTLFRRTTRKLDLTQEGEVFLDHARGIIQAFELAEDSMHEKSKIPSGLLRIDSASPVILNAITPFLQEFIELYPLIRFEIHSSERIIDLLEKRIDVAIRVGQLEDSTLHATHLGSSRLRILASPEYLAKHGKPNSAEDLAHHRLLGFTAPRELNHWPLKHGDGSSYPAKIHTSASSGETVLHLARSGAGIACLSDFMTKVDRAEGTLVQILRLDTLEVRQEINAVYYKNKNISQRTFLFIQFLKKKLKLHLNSSSK